MSHTTTPARTAKAQATPVAAKWDPELVEIDRLQLDPANPRLAEYGIHHASTQQEVLEVLWRKMAVDEIASSIAANGYFPYEPVFAQPAKDGKFVVIEGNRRLAAVMLLRDQALQQRIKAQGLLAIPQAAKDKLRLIPVIKCDRKNLWEYLGFKHVNGPQNWESFAKAEYIAWVHNELGHSLDHIAQTIGDKHATVARLYQGVQALNQAEKAKVFDRSDRYKNHFSFSHLYTGLGYAGIQKFLDLEDDAFDKKAPVPRSKVKELGELCLWLFGSESTKIEPVVQSQNPDLRQLDEAIQSARGLAAIRSGLPLRVALDISRGDELRFREAMVAAKERLQIARGTLLTGYAGEADLLELAKEINVLSETMLKDMADTRAKRKRTSEPSRRGK
jgi:hypothetical protein